MLCKFCNTEHPENDYCNPFYCIARMEERIEGLEEDASINREISSGQARTIRELNSRLGLSHAPDFDLPPDEITPLKEQIAALTSELSELEGKLQGEQGRNKDLGEQVDALTSEIGVLGSGIEHWKALLGDAEARVHRFTMERNQAFTDNSTLRSQNSAMNASLVELGAEVERMKMALEKIAICLDLKNPKGKKYSIADLYRIAEDALKQTEPGGE